MNEPHPILSPRDDTPWYRQFWPWFLIALPAATVIAGIVTLVIATRGADVLLLDAAPGPGDLVTHIESDA